eukprot:TRINITY_DN2901_c0_g1_i1.p1 TRINITY_DN2901_c0_g1~~TRINITY_DN2901_c0_g1_i1.p1  ORF type:complete len:354 (+),score=80.30 TRINITY_DN2901_c0_g1_i1:1787-2848(+)
MKKFEVARGLHKVIDRIRSVYHKQMSGGEPREKQLAVALYFIDKLALRVGNEKDEETADTVGCCSLRIEHITLKQPDIVEFDFLGKDSMRYQNSVSVLPVVYKCVKSFMKGKKPSEDLFDLINAPALNDHLKKEMPGLTAKVFRTYNASYTLEKELKNMPPNFEGKSVEEKLLFYNRCNREVAILCNHQRSLPKKHNEQMGKIDEKLTELKKELELLKKHRAILKGELKPSKAPSTPRKTPSKKSHDEAEMEIDEKKTKNKKKARKDSEDDDEDDDSVLKKKIVKTKTEIQKETTKIDKETGEKTKKKEVKETEEVVEEEETEEEKMKKITDRFGKGGKINRSPPRQNGKMEY